MIKQRCQRSCYVVLGYDRGLISDAKINLHALVDLKTAEHHTRADKELVSAGAHATRPLNVVEREFRPEIFPEMILESHTGEERGADVVALVSRDRIADRPLNVEITPADAS